nr:hypothetical protein [Bacteroidota bacterium]
MLEFKHYIWNFAGSGYSYKVETSSDGGITWNEIWSVSPTGDIGPETLKLLIENDNVEVDNGILVYPNPANDVVNINHHANIQMIEVYNCTGTKVCSSRPVQTSVPSIRNIFSI